LNKIRKVVLREDYLSICDNPNEAIVLAQMIYWAERVKDADKLIIEENKFLKKENEEERELFHGWIYKSALQLEEELMGFVSRRTITNVLKTLVDKGFLFKRNNPKLKWDRTFQYRVNLILIAKKLKENNYVLEGYSFDVENEDSNALENITTPLAKIANGKAKIANRKAPIAKQYQRLLTKIINKNYKNSLRENFDEDLLIQLFKKSYSSIYNSNYTFSKEDLKLIKHFSETDFENVFKAFISLPFYYNIKLEQSGSIENYHFTPSFIFKTFRFNQILSDYSNNPLIQLNIIKEYFPEKLVKFKENYKNFSFDELNNPEIILKEIRSLL